MTKRLYEADSYCREFTATVLSCSPQGEHFAVELDATAFFPEGGGQIADTGYLEDARVMDVQLCEGVILHTVDRPLSVGAAVSGRLDWATRFQRMQKHTAEHIVCGHIHREFGYDNVGFHLGSEDVTLDVDGELTREQIDRIERLANRTVWENRAVTACYPADPAAVDHRSKKEIDGPVRVVTIEGVDACACCAPHVARTGEIGVIKLLDAIRWKGGMRIHLQAGGDALTDYHRRYTQSAEVAAKLSVKQFALSDAVDNLLAERDALRLQLRRTGRKIADLQVAAVAATDAPVYLVGEDWDAETLRAIVNGLAIKCGGLCGAFSGGDSLFNYVVGGTGDLPAFGKRMNAALNGRGGGSAQQIQGRVQATEGEIAAFWQEIAAEMV